MNYLHLINKTGQPLQLCLHSHKKGDSILLIENGIYCLLEHPKEIQILKEKCLLYALSSDIKSRGLAKEYLNNNHCSSIGFSEFVKLTDQYQKTLTWF